ncbi:Sua5/YciO/YrdC/YwlC family protein [Candidatus Woesearchaeota archaeon]|nr:Sua5/YciO/YrdC/YwlC family protein [Candidatus Woesearchaeota archaeon]
MQVINKEELTNFKRKYLKKMKESVFIYPTDSIYGIGCDATKPELVDKIRKLKKSNIQPFSVIAPSKEWIQKNCEINKEQKKYFDALGKKLDINGKEHCFTLILKLKNKNAVAHNVTQGINTLGVRIPSNWFSEIVKELEVPIISTSANSTGENFMTSLDDLNESVKKGVDFIIYEGEKKSVPSTIINLVTPEIQIKERTKK